MPLVIHNRDSDKDLMKILRKYQPKGVIHCFSGNLEMAKEVVDLGLLISFTGIITFKNSLDLVEAASIIPLDYLLVETDSPYLAPIPYRGKTNEPSYIIHTIKKLAVIKKTSEEEVIKSTTENFNKLFNIL